MIVLSIVFNILMQVLVWIDCRKKYKDDDFFGNCIFFMLVMFVGTYQVFGYIPGLEGKFFELHKTLNECHYYPTTILTIVGALAIFFEFVHLVLLLPSKIRAILWKVLSWPFRKYKDLDRRGYFDWLKPIVKIIIEIIKWILIFIYGVMLLYGALALLLQYIIGDF